MLPGVRIGKFLAAFATATLVAWPTSLALAAPAAVLAALQQQDRIAAGELGMYKQDANHKLPAHGSSSNGGVSLDLLHDLMTTGYDGDDDDDDDGGGGLRHVTGEDLVDLELFVDVLGN
ncbi:hypothetical protein MN608_10206 [Microdochium nivale]|nr:hypothetical protein MN608_10206 [Microdochium nivale]